VSSSRPSRVVYVPQYDRSQPTRRRRARPPCPQPRRPRSRGQGHSTGRWSPRACSPSRGILVNELFDDTMTTTTTRTTLRRHAVLPALSLPPAYAAAITGNATTARGLQQRLRQHRQHRRNTAVAAYWDRYDNQPARRLPASDGREQPDHGSPPEPSGAQRAEQPARAMPADVRRHPRPHCIQLEGQSAMPARSPAPRRMRRAHRECQPKYSKRRRPRPHRDVPKLRPSAGSYAGPSRMPAAIDAGRARDAHVPSPPRATCSAAAAEHTRREATADQRRRPGYSKPASGASPRPGAADEPAAQAPSRGTASPADAAPGRTGREPARQAEHAAGRPQQGCGAAAASSGVEAGADTCTRRTLRAPRLGVAAILLSLAVLAAAAGSRKRTPQPPRPSTRPRPPWAHSSRPSRRTISRGCRRCWVPAPRSAELRRRRAGRR